ncbi:ERF family protein [Pediococcus inopinatus]|uniref:ERF family protein n=1 Tax=Pediococcus inopinatus TaxID=114090 RepID=UPI002B25F4B5|nr:ERF family protein [Pediococcus inopinatus]WPC19475.1 ERF family protein [Pediococcus inopinatus]
MSEDESKVTYNSGIIEKLVNASKLIGPIKKDGENKFQHYNFQSEGAIKDAVKNAIETVGISIIPSYTVTNQYDLKSSKGGNNHYVDVMGEFTITDGKDQVVGHMPGSGQDSGEKAMAKACTSAQKYFYKQLFNITDRDEDPDATSSQGSYQRSGGRSQSNQYSSRQSQAKRTNTSQASRQTPPRRSSQPVNRPVANKPAHTATSTVPKAKSASAVAIAAQKQQLITEVKRIAAAMKTDNKTVINLLFATYHLDYAKDYDNLTIAQLNDLVSAAKKMPNTKNELEGDKA